MSGLTAVLGASGAPSPADDFEHAYEHEAIYGIFKYWVRWNDASTELEWAPQEARWIGEQGANAASKALGVMYGKNLGRTAEVENISAGAAWATFHNWPTLQAGDAGISAASPWWVELHVKRSPAADRVYLMDFGLRPYVLRHRLNGQTDAIPRIIRWPTPDGEEDSGLIIRPRMPRKHSALRRFLANMVRFQ